MIIQSNGNRRFPGTFQSDSITCCEQKKGRKSVEMNIYQRKEK